MLTDEALDHHRDLLLLRAWEFGDRFKQAAHPASRSGEYATHAQMETFTARNRGANGHTEDLASLCGARLVTAVETEESKRLSEGLIKQITGNDPVTASKKNEHSFTFVPQFKLWLAANHKPIVRGTDEGIWRRPMLIPFNVKFEIDPEKRAPGEREGDPRIELKLLAELPGILNWALEGYREWVDVIAHRFSETLLSSAPQ